MKKRLGLMVAGAFADVRCGRITEALSAHGWEHDLLTTRMPPQFAHVYREIDSDPFRTYRSYVEAIKRHPAELIHVHGELYGFWPLYAALEGANGRPVIFNVHDLPSACGGVFDPMEQECIEKADALVWVTDEMATWASTYGIAVDKPSCTISNYPSSSVFIDSTPLPHIGGVVYEGGCDKRGTPGAWRDQSYMADALGGQLHIYPGNPGVDYGIVHPTETTYPLLIHRLAQHDWGLVGAWPANDDLWNQSVPTKTFEYMAAGIPFIALNMPRLKPLCKAGFGRYAYSLEDLPKLAKLDPAPYRAKVLAHRHEYALENHIQPLVDLYAGLS